MTEETQALVDRLRKTADRMANAAWAEDATDAAAALTALARDLETARQERDAALANCKNWWKLRAELATKQNDTLRAERDAAVRAARAEMWAAAAADASEWSGYQSELAKIFAMRATAAREGQ